MSAGVDLSQFYETFFDEADELLADMEQILLNVDIDQPDPDQLNAIFRAAHSIKGGAGTFGCFGQLAETTHLLENLLDSIRQGELALRKDMIDLFLETKDVLTEQVAAYRDSQQPDQEAYERICAQLHELALEHKGEAPLAVQHVPEAQATTQHAAQQAAKASGETAFAVHLDRIQPKDAEALLAEMHLLGEISRHEQGPDTLSVWMRSTCSA
ncbi:Hpt domain-containing protein, partial [Pusillimonas sp.]|uniref:Hpt domain-containing protein n=1 Tax=Pusillimonas sp. TaxID=3040095 RepID=UPI0037CC25B0